MIKLLIIDVDGVMTDGKKYYDRNGNCQLKTFCDKDWTAIKRFKAIGVTVIFLTADSFNMEIAKNRNIVVFVNRNNDKHENKVNYISQICNTYNVKKDDIAYIGDDLFDIDIMNAVKYSFCPNNSPKIVKSQKNIMVLDNKSGDDLIMNLFDVMEDMKIIPYEPYGEIKTSLYELDEIEKI